MPITEAAIREIAGSLVPPACEGAILEALANLDIFAAFSEDVAKEKVTAYLDQDSRMHARGMTM